MHCWSATICTCFTRLSLAWSLILIRGFATHKKVVGRGRPIAGLCLVGAFQTSVKLEKSQTYRRVVQFTAAKWPKISQRLHAMPHHATISDVDCQGLSKWPGILRP